MKKFILPLAVLLLATPAWATVAITVVDEGNSVAAINYAVSGEPNKVRAFALDIKVDAGEIVAISDYMKGEGDGFGIFPASFRDYITVDPATGEVATWDVNDYTPLADPNDPGALDGLGTAGITIEMGALYYPTGDSSPNAPPDSGTLCKVTVSETCTMTVEENATRGGIVLTDPSVAPSVDLTGATDVPVGPSDCFPASLAAQYADFLAYKAVGADPSCWCAPPYGSGYQCDGDADGKTQGFLKERIMTNDLAVLADNWKKKITDPTINPCADIDHKGQGFLKERVMTNDLAILATNWKKKDADLPGDCPRP
jgi:hypothetical protein